MDRLGRRGGLSLNWAFTALEDGERRGSGELSEDNSSSAGRSMSSGTTTSLPLSDEMEEVGEEVPVIYRPSRPPTGFAGARYPLTIGLRVQATRPPAWPAPLILPPSLGARGGTNLQGEGLLGCWT